MIAILSSGRLAMACAVVACVLILSGFTLKSCTVHNKNVGENIMSSDNNNAEISTELFEITGEYEIPPGAIVWYTLKYDDFLLFFDAPTIETLNKAHSNISYIIPSEIDGHIIVESPYLNITYEGESGRIGNYNFDIDYYNILSNKQLVSQIISYDLTEADIESVIIIEYSKFRYGATETPLPPGTVPRMVFWVQTSNGKYVLIDNYKHDEEQKVIHNWSVYTHKEYRW
jgi:hypothetical protein